MTLDAYPILNYHWSVINEHHGAQRKKHSEHICYNQCTMTKLSYEACISIEIYNELAQ